MHTSFINSEGSLADAFIGRYKDELRYDCKKRRWYLRTPEGWVLDDTDLVFDMVRQFCREVGRDKERSDREWLNRSRTYQNVLLIARSDSGNTAGRYGIIFLAHGCCRFFRSRLFRFTGLRGRAP